MTTRSGSERRSEAILEDIFDDFLRFFIPDADELFDMSRGFEFLDKELEQSFYGTNLTYQFNSYKVLDQNSAALEASNNPFAAVILTVLLALQKQKIKENELLLLKIDLAKRLLAKPFPKDKIRALMNFLKCYVRFKKPEIGVIFEQEYDKLTDRRQTMGIEEYLLYRAEKLGERKGEKKGLKIRLELAKLERDTLFVTNLIEGSTFTDEEIARFADVSVDFVVELRKQTKP